MNKSFRDCNEIDVQVIDGTESCQSNIQLSLEFGSDQVIDYFSGSKTSLLQNDKENLNREIMIEFRANAEDLSVSMCIEPNSEFSSLENQFFQIDQKMIPKSSAIKLQEPRETEIDRVQNEGFIKSCLELKRKEDQQIPLVSKKKDKTQILELKKVKVHRKNLAKCILNVLKKLCNGRDTVQKNEVIEETIEKYLSQTRVPRHKQIFKDKESKAYKDLTFKIHQCLQIMLGYQITRDQTNLNLRQSQLKELLFLDEKYPQVKEIKGEIENIQNRIEQKKSNYIRMWRFLKTARGLTEMNKGKPRPDNSVPFFELTGVVAPKDYQIKRSYDEIKNTWSVEVSEIQSVYLNRELQTHLCSIKEFKDPDISS